MEIPTFISWPEFENNASKTSKQLWNNPHFTDVTLATSDDQQIEAHKIILSSCSHFFMDILLKNPHENPLIYLEDIKYSQLKNILEFIYLGECTVDMDQIKDFLAIGSDLEISGINNLDIKAKEPIYPGNNDTGEDTKFIKEVGTNFMKFENHPQDISETEDGKHIAEENYQEQLTSGVINCNTCNVKFENKRALNKHTLQVHDLFHLQFKCAQCYFVTKSSASLSRHTSEVHEGIRSFCEQCKYSCADRGFMKKHIQSVHEGVRYYCEDCGKEFKLANALKEHTIRIHEQHSPLQCDKCDSTFKSKSGLTCHKLSRHGGKRLFCDQCNYNTYRTAYLRLHISNVHTK